MSLQFKQSLRFDKVFSSEEFRLASLVGGRGWGVHIEFWSLEVFSLFALEWCFHLQISKVKVRLSVL